jgi:hypothetical protein
MATKSSSRTSLYIKCSKFSKKLDGSDGVAKIKKSSHMEKLGSLMGCTVEDKLWVRLANDKSRNSFGRVVILEE